MRVLASFFAVLASITTIFAAIVRLWWSKPKITNKGLVKLDDSPNVYMEQEVRPPKAPSWLRTTAKWWLRIVVFGLTIGALIVVITIAVRIINISN